MKSILSWFDNRIGVSGWWAWLAESPVPGRACWCKVLPATILFTLCVQAITGFFLWVYYSPSAQTAWESVYYLQYETVGGWILRAMHHYSAHVMLALLILLLVQSVFTYAYRAPREMVFWATIGLGLCALATILTGDLLSWDQNGYASTKTRTGFLTLLPVVGDSLLKLAIGGPGPALGHHTVTRFFALHVGLFGAAMFGLYVIRSILARRASAAEAAVDGYAEPYWPGQAWRSAVACLVVLAVILVLSCQHGIFPPHAGVTLLSPADTDPANGYSAARPEWFLVGVFEFSHLFPGELAIIPVFIVPGILVGIALLMPFVAKHYLGHIVNMAFTVALLVGLVGISWYSLAKDAKNAEHQAVIKNEKEQAERVRVLAWNLGIPPTGALTLLRDDPKTQGPRVFKQVCASCHDSVVADGKGETADIKAEKSSAPNLGGFASRAWLAGFLDPKKIGSPEYYGNTKFAKGKMAAFVKDTFGDLDEDDQAKLAKVVMAVSAEAKLFSQRELDAKDAADIEEGRTYLTDDFGCTDCHKFHDKGSAGDAPDLTGYGSAEWTAGIICNPADKRFYGATNDRMPAYAASSDAAQNALNPHQIKMLTDWLRGEWFREPVDEAK